MVLAFPIHGGDCPVRDGNGNTEKNNKEDVGLESAAIDNGGDTLQDVGNTKDENDEVDIGEVAITLDETDKRSVFDGRCGGDTYWRERHDDACRMVDTTSGKRRNG